MIKTLFSISWWVGFLVAVGLMVGLYMEIGVIETINSKNLFLILGITHMFILVILGFWSILKFEDDNVEVANRVSTMGYLHTLIGTSIALIAMGSIGDGDISTNMNLIIIPIGSALITSIIGWAFGKEMERNRYRFVSSKREDVDDSLEFLAEKIRMVGINIEATSMEWGDNIDRIVNKLLATTERLEKNIEISQKSFDKSSQDSQEFLNQVVNTFQKIFTQMETVSTEWDNHIKTMQRFSSNADDSLEDLFKNSREIAKEITIVAETLPKASSIIKEVDSLIALLKERDENEL